jgi:hypothetical protein
VAEKLRSGQTADEVMADVQMTLPENRNRAPTARNMKPRASAKQSERVARGCDTPQDLRPKRPNITDITPFQGYMALDCVTQGRRAPLRFALAPGSHIVRLWRGSD